MEQKEQELPLLFTIDSKGKERSWKIWVIGNTIYRSYGLVGGKLISSERTFEGKSKGKKNETTPEEQAWAEANKEWIEHVDKKYAPAENDTAGQKMLVNLVNAKQKTGGHNINSVAATSNGARSVKTISRTKAETFIVDDMGSETVIPMKAEVWELSDTKDPHSVLPKVAKFFSTVEGKGKSQTFADTDYYGQPKLDGWRAIIRIQQCKGNWNVIITSNSGKQYPWFESLREYFKKWLTNKNIEETDMIGGLDGELFAMQFYNKDGTFVPESERFSTICSICGLARSVPHELENQIQFHCFDLLDPLGIFTQVERFKKLDKLFKYLPKPEGNASANGIDVARVVRVPTKILHSVSEAPEYHNECAALGYEGAIFRTFDLCYKAGKRSGEMRKYKNFIDEEYKVVDCVLDKGVAPEHFVWKLTTDKGDIFSAKPVGTREEKHFIYQDRKKYIGQFLTVKFQEFSGEGIPRFPIAKSFRSAKGAD